jgi:hypothetical protein
MWWYTPVISTTGMEVETGGSLVWAKSERPYLKINSKVKGWVSTCLTSSSPEFNPQYRKTATSKTKTAWVLFDLSERWVSSFPFIKAQVQSFCPKS